MNIITCAYEKSTFENMVIDSQVNKRLVNNDECENENIEGNDSTANNLNIFDLV